MSRQFIQFENDTSMDLAIGSTATSLYDLLIASGETSARIEKANYALIQPRDGTIWFSSNNNTPAVNQGEHVFTSNEAKLTGNSIRQMLVIAATGTVNFGIQIAEEDGLGN